MPRPDIKNLIDRIAETRLTLISLLDTNPAITALMDRLLLDLVILETILEQEIR